ncbi:uncharacterized protein LOC134190010 isoform X2 [Corticium candelabrum]|uniref:uncharacterized protein LOC134190010 isoform X2 n=1 Tax=Corticium candelabrum TaxID=121492 RepID=UPI002E25791F|nr:uncharacterized protein LOC134190010 isoform X2 [Corticium candelabrum]
MPYPHHCRRIDFAEHFPLDRMSRKSRHSGEGLSSASKKRKDQARKHNNVIFYFAAGFSPTPWSMRKLMSDLDLNLAFSQQQCTDWFCHYTESKDTGMIGPEGVERLCHELEIAPEDDQFLKHFLLPTESSKKAGINIQYRVFSIFGVKLKSELSEMSLLIALGCQIVF